MSSRLSGLAKYSTSMSVTALNSSSSVHVSPMGEKIKIKKHYWHLYFSLVNGPFMDLPALYFQTARSSKSFQGYQGTEVKNNNTIRLLIIINRPTDLVYL